MNDKQLEAAVKKRKQEGANLANRLNFILNKLVESEKGEEQTGYLEGPQLNLSGTPDIRTINEDDLEVTKSDCILSYYDGAEHRHVDHSYRKDLSTIFKGNPFLVAHHVSYIGYNGSSEYEPRGVKIFKPSQEALKIIERLELRASNKAEEQKKQYSLREKRLQEQERQRESERKGKEREEMIENFRL